MASPARPNRQHVLIARNENLQEVQKAGVRKTVHVLIATYTEPPETVNESVRRFLAAPTPLGMEVHVYVCDDGHGKSTGPGKSAFVQCMRSLGASSAPCFSHHLPILTITSSIHGATSSTAVIAREGAAYTLQARHPSAIT